MYLKKLWRSIIALIIAILCVTGNSAADIWAAGSYDLHLVNSLRNTDALYNDFAVKNNLSIGYITNLKSPVWKVINSNFKTVTSGAMTYLYTSPTGIPKEAGKSHAATWTNVASITYRDAGYYGKDKNNKFDIVFTLTKVVTMKPTYTADIVTSAPYYTVAITDNSTGIICSNSYVRNSDFTMTAICPGPFTIENWSIKILDKNGNKLPKVLLTQTYRDIDIPHVSNDSSFDTFNESFYFKSGYANDTYVLNKNLLAIHDRDGKSNAMYEATEGHFGDLDTDDQRTWVVAAMLGGEAQLEWTGQGCGSFIANTVFKEYPDMPKPVKAADKEYVKANEVVEYTVTEDFPVINPSNCPKAVTVTDTFDNCLAVGKNIKVTCGGKDVTDSWTVRIEGQKVTMTADKPGTVEGRHVFKIPVTVRDEKLDGKTLVVKDGKTYAEIPNTAYIRVKDQNDKNIDLETPKIIILEEGSSISLAKDVDRSKIDSAQAGDILKYSFRIKNTGRLTLHEVALADTLPVKDLKIDWKSSTDETSDEGVLVPGEEVTASAVYELTTEDIAAGKVINTASASGLDPKDTKVSDKDDAETELTAEPSISLSKTADPQKMTDPSAGDLISYNFVIANTGKTPLTDIKFQDDHELIDLTWSADLAGTELGIGDKIEGHASYRLNQSDIDAGSVLNKASITAVGGSGKTVTDLAEDTTIIETTPAIQLKKTTPEAVLSDVRAGDTVVWNFELKNTGFNTLKNVKIADHLAGVSEITYDWKGSSDSGTGTGILSPGETVRATATYALTGDDIVAKELTNSATGKGTDPKGTEVTSDSSAKVKIKYKPSLKIEKKADPVNYTGAKAGDVITYMLSLTNDGNVDLTDVELADLKEGVVVKEYNWPTREGFLAAGETVSATAEYVLTQEDIDVTTLENEASGKGKAPDGTWVYDKVPNTITKELNPQITLVKDVDINEITEAKAGDILTYKVTVTNTGDVTLHDVILTDSMENVLTDVVYDKETETLAPLENFVMTAKYTVTQDDINNGIVTNAAIVTAKDPENTEVSSQDEVNTKLGQRASCAVTKKVSVTKISSTDARAGYEIRYEFSASNTGNTTLTDVTFADEMLESKGSQITWDWSDAGILLPGETISGHAVYALTQEDINAGELTNVVIMNAKDPKGNPLEPARAEVKTIIEKNASHKIVKSVDKENIEKAKAGDTLSYTMVYTNTGNMVLRDISFTDEMLKEAGIDIQWDWSDTASRGESKTLIPGESVTGQAAYKITQADIDAGKITNLITAYASDSEGNPLEPAVSEVTTQVTQTSKINVKKSADKVSLNNPKEGAVLTYNFTIANEGCTTLKDIKLIDSLSGHGLSEIKMNYPDISQELKPGSTMTASATYALTSADIKAGKVVNSAYVTARDPSKKDVTSKKSEVTTKVIVPVTPTQAPTNTPSPVPTIQQVRYSTQTVTSPKTGDNTAGIIFALIVLAISPVLFTILIKKYQNAGKTR